MSDPPKFVIFFLARFHYWPEDFSVSILLHCRDLFGVISLGSVDNQEQRFCYDSVIISSFRLAILGYAVATGEIRDVTRALTGTILASDTSRRKIMCNRLGRKKI